MSRIIPEASRHSALSPDPSRNNLQEPRAGKDALRSPHVRSGLLGLRALIFLSAAAAGYALRPFGLQPGAAAGVAGAMALILIAVEVWMRRVEIASVLGAAFGGLIGILTAALIAAVISHAATADSTKASLEYFSLLAFGFLGLAVGFARGGETLSGLFGLFSQQESVAAESPKLLDTSVLIDGRIADICEAHFLDGTLTVPQFVLHELQQVADSSDSLKRQRGRRGLEVLQRMQKMPQIEVLIVNDDFAMASDVDHKLVELARHTHAKIVTNDYNLNKVATVQGIVVMNVNQLANALKPAVLPGEPMRVLILREGKEPNQGVAYLDDGTMVVVDGARRMINKTADVIVTSVHQTTAGKMIFGRLDERGDAAPSPARPVAAAAAAGAGAAASRSDGVNGSSSATTLPAAPPTSEPPSSYSDSTAE